MINGTQVTIVGNVGGDPELRFTPSGAAVASFNVAVTPRKFDQAAGKWVDGDATWYRCNAWRNLAENVAESLTKGQRVIVVGNLAARPWKNDAKGSEGISWEIAVDAVGPDLQWSTAKVTKSTKSAPGRDVPPPDDPWQTAPAGVGAGTSTAGGYHAGDEPPF